MDKEIQEMKCFVSALRSNDGMILYHGSYTEIPQINLCKCEAGKDFGQEM